MERVLEVWGGCGRYEESVRELWSDCGIFGRVWEVWGECGSCLPEPRILKSAVRSSESQNQSMCSQLSALQLDWLTVQSVQLYT